MRSSGHRVLITGGAKGIGFALARWFHAAGNEVTLIGRDGAALQAATLALPGVSTRVADVSSADDRAMLARDFTATTVLVNNAGIQRNGDFAATPAAEVERELHIDLLAPIMLAHAFLPHLQGHAEAAIVNVSSVLALVPKQSASVYCAAKAALHSFSRSLRWQLEGSNVRVFEIMPPLVDTAMTAGRGRGKMPAGDLAAAFWAGYLANRFELRIGKARAAGMMAQWLPPLAERILRHG